MKKTLLPSILSLFFVIATLNSLAQTPNWQWAQRAGGNSDDKGYSVSTDASGNVFMAGSFAGSSITFGTTTLTNAGGADMFIVKYDGSGNVLWAISAGGTNNDEGNSVATDANGNILVTGYFASSSITFGTIPLTNTGGTDMFIVKYDGSGNVLWAKSAGGTDSDAGNSVATDANGNILVTGLFYSSSIIFGTTTLTNAGGYDIFIVKYDSQGNVLWAKSVGGTNDDRGYSVATDANGNILVTGLFYSPSITLGSTTLTNANTNYTDMFIVKYDGSGNVLWAQRAGGASYDEGRSVATDANGNILVTGSFYSPSITFGTTTLTNAGSWGDMFIVKYNSSGNVLWAKSEGGTSGDIGNSVATDANGNILVTGFFYSPSITLGSTTLTNAGGYDIFIVKYDSQGNVLWAKSAGGTNDDLGNSVATDASGNVFMTGWFTSSSITFGTTTLTNAGSSFTDMFLAKVGNSGPCVAPAISTQPASTIVTVGQPATFGITATGTAPLSYQWKKNTVNISGAINSSFTISSTVLGDAGNYTCYVSNSCGNITSNIAVLTVSSGCIAPTITTHPASTSKNVGQAVTFNVIATGTATLNYQWKKNTVNISGATNSSYTISSTQLGDAGNYACYVSNSCGNITSNVAVLTVTNATPSNITINNVILNNTTFPNPKLLWSGTTSQTASTIKICADASTATHISFVNNTGINSNNIKFWIASDTLGANSDASGYFINYNVTGNTITAEYAHPKYLQSSYAPFRSDNIRIVNYTNSFPSIFTIPVEIYRAPVIMVHGLWGDFQSFLDMKNFLDASGYYPFGNINQSLLLLNVDYSATNSNSFFFNRNVVPTNINTILNITRMQHFSAGKVDVVAHSMGGLLARYYLQSSAYQQKQDIHKLITINTPHSGSQLANLITNTTNDTANAAKVVAEYIYGNSIYNGAITDLAVGGPRLNYLNNTTLNDGIVPSHSIITTSQAQNICNESLILQAAAPIANMTLSNFANYLFYNETNDIVVSSPSQSGGLPSNATTTFTGQFHIGSPANSSVMTEVKNALNINSSNSNYFGQSGFAPVVLSSHYLAPYNPSSYIRSGSNVHITSPVQNQNFNPGDLIPVNITSSNGVNRIILAGLNVANTFVVDTMISNGIINYSVPANAFGKVKFIALGYDPNNLIDYDTVSININQTASLDSISSYSNKIYVQVNNIASVSVTGYFNNGNHYSVSNQNNIYYQIADTNIAKHTVSNLLQGKQVGITTLLATYLGHTKTILVEVIPQDTTIHLATSINENQISLNNPHQSKINIYPNPFNTSATAVITDNAQQTNAIWNLVMYDLLGREVKKIQAPTTKFIINRDGLPIGMYFYNVTEKTGVIVGSGKLIIAD